MTNHLSRLNISRSEKIILALALPTLLAFPALAYLEVKKLYLPATWSLSREARNDFYVGHAMPVIPDDYFTLLEKLKPYLGRPGTRFDIIIGEGLDPALNHIVHGYTKYRLLPSVYARGETNLDMIIHFRSVPKEENAILLVPGNGFTPSYAVPLRPNGGQKK